LIERGVIGDFRAPDLLRFGLTPLTLRHTEVWDAAEILNGIVANGDWRHARLAIRRRVT
jgi:kynureninase